MIGIVYSKLDQAGVNMASHIIKKYDFGKSEDSQHEKYQNDIAKIYEVDVFAYKADIADSFKCSDLVFLSGHASGASIEAFTTHSLGNWRQEAPFGGLPKQLSFASPVLMLEALRNINKIEFEIQKTYEGTHHGPFLKTPSLFVELGGTEQMLANKSCAAMVADAAYETIVNFVKGETEFKKVVVGIGGTHYPEKFSKLAIEKGYAFSHIMPKYAITNEDGSDNLSILEQTLIRSDREPDRAVIDWKSLNSISKERTLRKLEEMGLDYEKA